MCFLITYEYVVSIPDDGHLAIQSRQSLMGMEINVNLNIYGEGWRNMLLMCF